MNQFTGLEQNQTGRNQNKRCGYSQLQPGYLEKYPSNHRQKGHHHANKQKATQVAEIFASG